MKKLSLLLGKKSNKKTAPFITLEFGVTDHDVKKIKKLETAELHVDIGLIFHRKSRFGGLCRWFSRRTVDIVPLIVQVTSLK